MSACTLLNEDTSISSEHIDFNSNKKPLRCYAERDHDGREIVQVMVSNRPGLLAKLFKEDYQKLVDQGLNHGWYLSPCYYKGNQKLYLGMKQRFAPGRKGRIHKTIASLILNSPPRKQIRFLDRNPLNLRSDNLFIPNSPR